MLKRRLDEREALIRIEKTGRGSFPSVVDGSLRLDAVATPGSYQFAFSACEKGTENPSHPTASCREDEMTKRDRPILMPSEVSERVGAFDVFAGWAARIASRAAFFTFCVLLVIIWAPTIFIFRDVDTWQLIINTVTTIITFLMVALLQNTQTRSDQALQHKLNAIADGLADLMAHVYSGGHGRDLEQDLIELRAAVGLEAHESTSRVPDETTAG